MCALKLAGDASTVLFANTSRYCQPELRTIVRTPSAKILTIGSTQRFLSFPPIAYRTTEAAAQNPIEGKYRKRSAMMLPMLITRFDVGSSITKKKITPHEK